MARIYQIHVESDAPRLSIAGADGRSLLPFDGSSKRGLAPGDTITVEENTLCDDPLTFWSLQPGVLVYSESLYAEFATAEDSPYYAFLSCGEFLSLRSGTGYYVAINSTALFDNYERASREAMACDSPLFRLDNHSRAGLFCVEGTNCAGNEFKHEYDRCRLRGLTFEEVWSSD